MHLETFTMTVYTLYMCKQSMHKNCFGQILSVQGLKAVLGGFRGRATEGRCWEFSSLPSFHWSSCQVSSCWKLLASGKHF